MAFRKTHFLRLVCFTSLFFIGALVLFTTILQPISWRLSSRTLLLANGAFACACVASVTYLIQEIQLKRKRFLAIFGHLPPLEKLDRICYQSVIIGLSLSTLALCSPSFYRSTIIAAIGLANSHAHVLCGYFICFNCSCALHYADAEDNRLICQLPVSQSY